MPLVKSGSGKAIKKNIEELYERNKELESEGKKPRPRKQIVAIALNEAKQSKKAPKKKK